jgi:hypothetical protein
VDLGSLNKVANQYKLDKNGLYQVVYLDPAPCGRRMVAEGGEHDVSKAKQGNEDQDYGKNLTSTPVILSRQDLRASS